MNACGIEDNFSAKMSKVHSDVQVKFSYIKLGRIQVRFVFVMISALLLSVLVACGGQEAESVTDLQNYEDIEEVAEEVVEEIIPELPRFGFGSTEVEITNNMGSAIIAVEAQAPSCDGWSEEFSVMDIEFPDGETGILAIDLPQREDGSLADEYSFRVTTEKDRFRLRWVPVEGISNLTLMLEDDMAFIVYLDEETGEEVSTLRREQRRVERAEARRAEEEELEEARRRNEEEARRVAEQQRQQAQAAPAARQAPAADDICVEPVLRD